jgi:hypothetical protein
MGDTPPLNLQPLPGAVLAGFPTVLPVEAVRYLVDVLRGEATLDYRKGVEYAYDTIGYLLGKFWAADPVSGLSAKAQTTVFAAKVKPPVKAPSKKYVAAALEELIIPTGKAAGQDFSWLVPILLDLVGKWLSGRKR